MTAREPWCDAPRRRLLERAKVRRRCPHCRLGLQTLATLGPYVWRACGMCGTRDAWYPADLERDIFGEPLQAGNSQSVPRP